MYLHIFVPGIHVNYMCGSCMPGAFTRSSLWDRGPQFLAGIQVPKRDARRVWGLKYLCRQAPTWAQILMMSSCLDPGVKPGLGGCYGAQTELP